MIEDGRNNGIASALGWARDDSYEDRLAQIVAQANADAAIEKALAVAADVQKMIAMRRKLFPGAFTEEQDERTNKGLVRLLGNGRGARSPRGHRACLRIST